MQHGPIIISLVFRVTVPKYLPLVQGVALRSKREASEEWHGGGSRLPGGHLPSSQDCGPLPDNRRSWHCEHHACALICSSGRASACSACTSVAYKAHLDCCICMGAGGLRHEKGSDRTDVPLFQILDLPYSPFPTESRPNISAYPTSSSRPFLSPASLKSRGPTISDAITHLPAAHHRTDNKSIIRKHNVVLRPDLQSAHVRREPLQVGGMYRGWCPSGEFLCFEDCVRPGL